MRNYVYEYFYKKNKIRIIVDQAFNDIWFCLKDISTVLKYRGSDGSRKNPLKKRIPKETMKYFKIDTGYGIKDAIFVNATGLSYILSRGNKDTVKEFQYWINSEVLKSTIQTGGFMTDTMLTEMSKGYPNVADSFEASLTAMHINRGKEDFDKIVKYTDYINLQKALRLEIKRRKEAERELRRLINIIDKHNYNPNTKEKIRW